MIVITTVTSSVGLPTESIPGDEPEEGPGSFFPSVYGGSPFQLTLSFEIKPDELSPSYELLSVTPTTDLSSIGINVSVISSSSVLISGNVINVFPGEFYRFVLRSGTEKILPPVNSEDWVAVTGWGIPTVVESDATYNFDIVYNDLVTTSTVSTSSVQFFFWSFNSSLNTFKNLINQGEF
jgi:hypothetical protein